MVNKEKQRATRNRWREKHKKERRAYEAKWRQEHKINQHEAAQKYNAKLKLEVFSHYSTKTYPICANCGIIDIDILCLDHIDGGGSSKRRSGLESSGQKFYVQLRKQFYPVGFQVLCLNCNFKKGITRGK